MAEEYKRSAHDELDWAEVDQLHAATLEVSKTCFEYKKLCVGLLGVGAAILAKFSDNPLSHISFAIALIICAGFWFADATAYYYQRLLRKRMIRKMEDIAHRNEVEDYEIDQVSASVTEAIFDKSMSLYFALIGFVLLAWLLV
jgi:hypothetical protein